MPDFDYIWFDSLVLVLALLLFVTTSRTRRRSTWVSAALLLVSAVALSRIASHVGLRWFPGFLHLSRFRVPHWEIVALITLFIVCFLDIPHILLQQPETKPHAIQTRLLSSLVFCVVYAWYYIQFTSWFGFEHIIWLTFLVTTLTGLAGTAISFLLFPSENKLFATLDQYQHSLRLVFSVFLLVSAIALPLFNDPQGALAYGISYETDAGTISKSQMQLDTYYNVANYYQSLGDTETALILFQEAIDRQPDFHDAYVHRADLLMQTERYQAAIADLDIAVSLVPTNTQLYYGRAMAYEALGDYDSAIQNLDQVVALEPDDELAYLARASFSIQAGDYEQALADADVLEEKMYEKFPPAFLKSVAYMGQQNTNEAQLALADFLEPDDRVVYPDLSPSLLVALPLVTHNTIAADSGGGIYFSNSYADALSNNIIILPGHMIQSSQGIWIHRPDAYTENLSLPDTELQSINFTDPLKARFRSTATVLEYLAPVVEHLATEATSQDATLIYTTLGSLNTSMGQPATALDYYERALGLISPTSSSDDLAELYYDLGRLNLQEGDIESGIEYLSKALEINPNHINALFARAQAYFDTDRVGDARADMQRVVQLDPDWTDARLAFAHYLNLTSDYPSALRNLSAIESDANNRPMYHHCLGYAYAATGDRSQAIDAYEQAFRLIKNMSSWSSDRTKLYEQIVDELHELELREPDITDITDDIWLMMRGAMSVGGTLQDTTQTDRFYSVSATSSANTPTTTLQAASLTITPTTPITQILWVQQAAVGPEKLRPGSSDLFEIVAELRRYPDTDGTAFPVELYIGHTYAIEVRPKILNFEFSGETDPKALTHSLELDHPVHWQWVISPKSDYEGNQRVTYEIIVHDVDKESDWSQGIPTSSIEITVPTRYGIPTQIAYPLSGIGAAAGTFLAYPLINAAFTDWLKRRHKDDEDDKDDDKDGDRPQLIIVSRDSAQNQRPHTDE